jgi:cytochrome c-type biogenesis protein CcmH
MRRIVREQIDGGKTDSQIREYFVERYGPVVLLEPSTSGIGLIAWIVPPAGLLIAICAVAMALIVMKRRRRENAPEDTLSYSDRERYFKLLEERKIFGDDSPGRET